MTIIEKNSLDSPWMFRTKPLQTGQTQSTREVALQLAPIPAAINQNQSQMLAQQQQQQQQQRPRVPPNLPTAVDPKKVVKSSTAPNLPTSNSMSEMFHVI